MVRAIWTALVAALAPCVAANVAWAQAQRQTPSQSYYTVFGAYYDGDYSDALRGFQSECRGSIKTAQSRWIDSICYETMCGECFYQMGLFDQALQRYTNALQLFRQFPDWMAKLQFSASIRDAGVAQAKAIPWGHSSRQSRLGYYPTNVLMAQGRTDIYQNSKGSLSIYQQANLFPITPQEIVRCTVLAMRRRAAILGPLAKQDPLTAELIAATSRTICLSNHWSQAWADIEHGMALLAGGKETQGVDLLQRSVMAAGQFDHPLTSVALLELGQVAMRHGDFPTASKYFEEATYAAVQYPDYGVLEEAFRYGVIMHLASNQKGFFKPLEPAIQWARQKNFRQLRASLSLSAAENYAVLGQTREAAAMIDEARATIGRRRMGNGWIGAKLSYVTALAAFQQQRIADGNAALAAAMDYMRHGSLWLYHIGLVDNSFVAGDMTARASMDLFAEVLRDPRPVDWALDPMEAFSVLVAPHPQAFEHWFEAAIDRRDVKDVHKAIEVADLARRHRFFTAIEFGGRLETLRWILESPAQNMPHQAAVERQDLLNRFPAYEELSRRAAALRADMAKKPLVAEGTAAIKEQTRELQELAAIGLKQEAMLREIALRREPAEMVFPPVRTVAEVQKALPNKQAILVFFATARHWYGFLLNNERCTHWRVNAPPAALKQMQMMLREMGNYNANHQMAIKDLNAVKWKTPAKQALEMLLKGSPADFSQPFDELAIVPDGVLWYLPFEALQVAVNGREHPLISRFRIRYAPTFSLCVSQGPPRGSMGNTAVVLGKLFPQDADSVAQEAFDKISAVVPRATAIHTPGPGTSATFSTLFQRLIVLDDLAMVDRDPFAWFPTTLDHGKPGGSLGDWLALPWGGPDVVVLPGFHTAAEDGLKRIGRGPAGDEMFLSVCGLMANGARTLLLSRWRTGGQTSFDLVREFVQELSDTTAADAWQRAVLVAVNSRVNLEAEPRLKRNPTDEDVPRAKNPFFWASFMLVDCGTGPEKSPEKPGAAAEPKKHAVPGKTSK